jgi:hypothetical protein
VVAKEKSQDWATQGNKGSRRYCVRGEEGSWEEGAVHPMGSPLPKEKNKKELDTYRRA